MRSRVSSSAAAPQLVGAALADHGGARRRPGHVDARGGSCLGASSEPLAGCRPPPGWAGLGLSRTDRRSRRGCGHPCRSRCRDPHMIVAVGAALLPRPAVLAGGQPARRLRLWTRMLPSASPLGQLPPNPSQEKRHRVWLNCLPLPNPKAVEGATRYTRASPPRMASPRANQVPSGAVKRRPYFASKVSATFRSSAPSLTVAAAPSTTRSRPSSSPLHPVVSTQFGFCARFLALRSAGPAEVQRAVQPDP